MVEVFGGREFIVPSVSNIHDDSESLEFRLVADQDPPIAIITQIGDYGSRDIRVLVWTEIQLSLLEEMIDYARQSFGAPAHE